MLKQISEMKMGKRISYVQGIIALTVSFFLYNGFLLTEDATWEKLYLLITVIALISIGSSFFINKKEFTYNTARIFSGILFVFSGFVKAVDPLGSKYKFIDYFDAWGMDFLNPTALSFGIILSVLELAVGLALLFKILPKLNSWLALLFMLVFTPLTFYLAMQQNISGKELVHDCGCFGDALILTNWQTFVKNLFILIPVIFIFFNKNKVVDFFSLKQRRIILSVFVVLPIIISFYALQHLPPIDFRPYKVGTELWCEKCSDIQKIDVQTYQYADFVNLKTGEHKEFDIVNNYPDYTIWEYNPGKEIRIVTVVPEKSVDDTLNVGGNVFIVNHMLFRKGADDYTCKIITDTNYVFLFIAYNLIETNMLQIDSVNEIYNWACDKKYAFYGVTSSLNEEVELFYEKGGSKFEFLDGDDIPLKTIVRANPGLVLLKNGVIINKWHSNDIPSVNEFEKMCK